jgi:SulP family sulfate permease
MELVAQGAANVLSPIFAGIPATGAIARTATNIKNGGRTPIAGVIHVVVLVLIMLFFGRWASLIPMPTLAAILVVVSYNMSEWHSFIKILRSPRSDVAVMLVTFALTVPDGIEVFEVHGSLFFGAVDQFTETIRALERWPKVFILETKHLLAIDASGIRALEDLMTQLSHQGTRFIVSGIHKQPLFAITQAGLLERIGDDNLCGDLLQAIERASQLTGKRPVGEAG